MCAARPRTSLAPGIVAHSLATGSSVVPNTARPGRCCAKPLPRARAVHGHACLWQRTALATDGTGHGRSCNRAERGHALPAPTSADRCVTSAPRLSHLSDVELVSEQTFSSIPDIETGYVGPTQYSVIVRLSWIQNSTIFPGNSKIPKIGIRPQRLPIFDPSCISSGRGVHEGTTFVCQPYSYVSLFGSPADRFRAGGSPARLLRGTRDAPIGTPPGPT